MCRTLGTTINCCLIVLGLLVSIAVVVYALFYARAAEEGPTSYSDPTGSRAAQTLKLLVVVSRHGSRRPLTSLPNESVHWNYGLGELTSIGHIQSYSLGVQIRKLYNGFLSTLYQSGDLLASSTPFDRTLMSGALFLAGLYPPTGFQMWKSGLNWQPIPLYSNSPDRSMSAPTQCPRFIQEEVSALRTFELDNADSINATNSYLTAQLGYNVTGMRSMYKVWDALTCEEVEGFPLPEWVTPVYPQPMTDLMGRAVIAIGAGTPTMIRLSIGPLFQQMMSVMARKVNGSLTPDRRLYYYSGHDITIVPLQALLGVPAAKINGVVSPSSALLFELHQQPAGAYSVQVLYLDGSSLSKDPRPIDISGCGNPCDLGTLANLTQQYTNISDYDLECQLNN